MTRPRVGHARRLAAAVALVLLALACTGGGADEEQASDAGTVGPDGGGAGGDDGCVAVPVAVSSEKIDLITDLAAEFNAAPDSEVDGVCTTVSPRSVASGLATRLLAEGWEDEAADGPRPVIWSPASSAWAAILNQRLAEQGTEAIAPPSDPFMLTPLVIAMPQPMAAALGYPEEPVGYADILALAQDDAGWGAFGNPQWGPFRLGKTNPNFSTSGLSALIAQYYAATGTTDGLTAEDLARPEVQEFARAIESSVVHYGDTTLTFLNNLARTDARGTSLTYASAVAVEEVSLINYNRGNPDGVLQPGEQPVEPRIPLVAVYPEEGTLFSDNPFITLDAEWVTPEQRTAAAAFEAYVQRPENQQRVLEFGFRPGNPEVPVGAPISGEFGVDPEQPQTALELPEPPVMVEVLERWEEQRKAARVLLTLDVSGSMGDPAQGGGRETKLDLAKAAAVTALEQFTDADEVGLRIFSTELSGADGGLVDSVDVVPIAPIGGQRDQLVQAIESLVPVSGTPLYTVTGDAYAQLVDDFDQEKINAVVLLTDGRNEDPRNDDVDALLTALTQGTEGGSQTPVRVFPIAYGADADLATLRRIAEATNAAVYDASDPRSIDEVFTAVISNF